jgi:hypothetical protein
VLDDHEEEFSIHKLDMDNDDPDVGCGSLENPLHFSEPPVLRVGSPTIRRGAQFAALGSHIIAICSKYGTLTFDTKTSTLDASHILPVDLLRPDRSHVYEVAMHSCQEQTICARLTFRQRRRGLSTRGLTLHC